MPASSFILLHWKRQQKVFSINLAILRNRYDEKAIHDLRVAVKKQRSYLRLADLILGTEKQKSLEKTERLFTVLGKHRDIQLGLSLLQAFEQSNKITYTAFRYHLKAALQRSQVWVKDALRKYEEQELTAVLPSLQESLKATDAGRWIEKTGLLINKELKKLQRDAKHFSTEPHGMRKGLKNVFYWISICPKEMANETGPVKKLKKSLDELGDWQDLKMLAEKARHFRKDFIPDAREEYLLLKNLEKNIGEKRESKLKKAEENFSEFINGK